MQVPWASPQGRFTLLFERFAVEVLLASGSVSQGCELLGIGWDAAQEIMRRAVERGLEQRQLEGMKYLGMDEKSFKRGQSYITLLTDLEESRVLDVVEERTTEAAGKLWAGLESGAETNGGSGGGGHVGAVCADDCPGGSRRRDRA